MTMENFGVSIYKRLSYVSTKAVISGVIKKTLKDY